MDILNIQKSQRKFLSSGATMSHRYRSEALDRLERATKEREKDLIEALSTDLGKSPTEAYATEIGIVYSELRNTKRHLGAWMKRKKVRTPLLHFPSSSYILKDPIGNVLIMSPWNYPVQLTLVPLIGAIAAGCTVFVKPSRYSAATSKVLCEIVAEAFRNEEVYALEGGRDVNEALLDLKWDYIFFTGSPAVGRIVMMSAARTLTPVTLELGGKSPVIVDETANLKVACTRLAFGKFINAGQTCVAPDYILVHESVKDEFIEGMKAAIGKLYGDDPLSNPEFPHIINEKHFARLEGIVAGSACVFGGKSDRASLKIEPTLLYPVDPGDPVMQEEIFGPVLPILTYSRLGEAIDFINSRPHPLALYIYSENRKNIRKVHRLCTFGGGCVNDSIMHLVSHGLPFGGVGESGTGSYHGRKSFDTFTHEKSILDHRTWLDITLRCPPFKGKDRIIRTMLK